MPSPATSLSRTFSGHLRYLEYTRVKMERLLARGELVNRDVNQVYVGLYLEVMTSFEKLIENLFVGLLSGTYTVHARHVVPLVSFRNQRAVHPIIFRERNFLDWLPYDRTEDRARQFFQNGVPFSCLAQQDKELIKQCMYIRNAIVHKSKYSLDRFELHVIGNQNLMSREKVPAGYLRSVFRTGPNQNRYQNVVQEMASIANKLCS